MARKITAYYDPKSFDPPLFDPNNYRSCLILVDVNATDDIELTFFSSGSAAPSIAELETIFKREFEQS